MQSNFRIRPLCKSLQIKAEVELNEDPYKIEEYVESLRKWLIKQNHLKYKNDDQFLANLLRISKCSIEQTKSRVDGYYTFRTIAPEITQKLDPLAPEFQAFLRVGMCIPLPTPQDDPSSSRAFLLRFGDYDPNKVTHTTLMKVGYAISEILLNNDDNFVVAGTKIVADMRGARLQSAFQLTPDLLKKALFCYQRGLPTRVQVVYVLNIPPFFEMVINSFKALLPAKLVKRLHFYSTDNWESVYKDIPKSILPTEYGGDAGPVSELAANWKATMEGYRDFLLDQDNYHSVELFREPTQCEINSGLSGQGSFKKLEVD